MFLSKGHTLSFSAYAAALFCAVAAVGTAQKPPTAVLRVEARIVYVDVVVRDGAGKIVHGLQSADFTLAESKQPQRIAVFEEHTSKMALDAVARRAASKQPAEYSNVAPDAQDTSLNMVLLDLLNTSPVDQAYARQRMISFLKQLPPGRQVALFVLNNGLHMIQGFTTDSAALVKAADEIDIKQLSRLRTPGQQVTDNDSAAYVDFALTGGTGAISAGGLLQKYAGIADVENMKLRLDATNSAFLELARAVNGYPGRKNLFWLAGQFPSSTYFTLQNISTSGPRSIPTPGGVRQDTERERESFAGTGGSSGLALRNFSEKADRAIADSQIAVYPTSLVGVQIDNVGADQQGFGSAGEQASATASLYFNERQTGRAVMEHIASETGGEAFYGNNDPAAMLQRGFEDGENYYSLAYEPTDHAWNDKYRSISVSIKGRPYKLSYRRGYFALAEQPTGNALQQFAKAMRIESPPSTMLVLHALPPATGPDGQTEWSPTLDLHGVAFRYNEATGERRAKLQVLLIAYPAQPGVPPVEVNHMLDLGLTEEDYRRYLGSGVPIGLKLNLPAGRYALRAGVLDVGSGRVGTLTVPTSR